MVSISICAARCPQGLVPYNVAILCRRLYGRYQAPVSQHLEERIADIVAGKCDNDVEKLKKADEKEMRRLYAERDIEPAY